MVAPFLNATLPTGTAPDVAVTVAVNVTEVFHVLGLALDTSEVPVLEAVTCWVNVDDVDVVKFPLAGV
jgi:hypothetical protein